MSRRLLVSPWAGPGLAALAGLAAGLADARSFPGDLLYFAQKGDTLLSSHWARTFADPGLQAGPIQVAVASALVHVAHALALSPELVLSLTMHTAMTVLLVVVTGLVVSDRAPRTRLTAQVVACVAGVALATTHGAYTAGHPAQVVTPLAWIAAGVLARRGRPGLAGAVVGLTAGLETWGVLGLPVLLLAPGGRQLVKAIAAAATVTSAIFLPFALAGSFRMFELAWPVTARSPASLVIATGSPFTWWMRLAQGAAALGAGVLVARRLRSAPSALWAIPLVVVAVRLGFEPILHGWYLIGLQTPAIVAAADLCTGRLAEMRAGSARRTAPRGALLSAGRARPSRRRASP